MKKMIVFAAAALLCCLAVTGYGAPKAASRGTQEKRLALPVAVTVCLPAGMDESSAEPAWRKMGFAPVFVDKARRAGVVLKLNKKHKYRDSGAYKLVVGRKKRVTAAADAEAGLLNALGALSEMAEKRCGQIEFPYCVLGALGDTAF